MEQGRKDGEGNQSPNRQPKRARLAQNPVFAHQPPPPQKCPRCDSINTKFCYYNNYSLGQPRYLCKACRRHWTHGGTLRNVPVGGGHRKGRRGRVPSGASSSRSRPKPQQRPRPQQPPPSQQPQVQFPNVTKMAVMFSGISWGNSPTAASIYPFGIFDAFEGVQLMPPLTQSQGLFNRPLRINDGTAARGDGANMPILSQQAQSQQIQPRQSGGGIFNRSKDKQPMVTTDENLLLPAGNPNSWTPGVNANNASTSTPNLWNNTNGASTSSGPAEPSFNQNDWPNIPDFDAPK